MTARLPEVMEQWARENYPRLVSNPRAIEVLYKRRVLNKNTMSSQIVAFPFVRFGEFEAGKPITTLVTKIDCTIRTTDICSNCFKRQCEHAGMARVPFYIVKLLGADDSNMETFQFMSKNKEETDIYENNDDFLVSGTYVLNEKWGNEFRVKMAIPLTKNQLSEWDALNDWYAIHGGEGGVSEQEFDAFVSTRKEALAPFLERVYFSRAEGRVRW